MQKQSIKGLEAAYKAVYKRELLSRVAELATRYDRNSWDNLCCELNPANSVPCHYSLTELVLHYADQGSISSEIYCKAINF